MENKEVMTTMDNTPISPWGYCGYYILFSIPIIGFICAIIFAVSTTGNINRRNLARGYWCMVLLAFIMIAFMLLLAAVAGISVSDATASAITT